MNVIDLKPVIAEETKPGDKVVINIVNPIEGDYVNKFQGEIGDVYDVRGEYISFTCKGGTKTFCLESKNLGKLADEKAK